MVLVYPGEKREGDVSRDEHVFDRRDEEMFSRRRVVSNFCEEQSLGGSGNSQSKLVGIRRNDFRVHLAQRSNATDVLPHHKVDERVSTNRRSVRGCEISRSEPDGYDDRNVSISVRGYVWRFRPRYYNARVCNLHGP